ncbi:MAG TPA: hypothetical protein PKI16_02575 [Candidatus Dojkabacteria bacterium]|nr:hypothetical protein [Candidatus Dojkabacteria bacterium]
MLTKEDLKAIEKILSPRFDTLDKRMDKLEERMDKLEKKMVELEEKLNFLEERLEKTYEELDRRICSIVDTVGEINGTLQGLALLDANSRGDIKRQEGNIQEVYKMNIEVNDRLDAIEKHLNTKYDPVSRSLMDKSKIEYERKKLKG